MVIIETSVFTRQVRKLLSDEEYRQLQNELVRKPKRGAVIRGSGGLRKIRWAAKGKGKSGGARVIYYSAARKDQLLMLFIYPKNERDDLSRTQLNILSSIVKEEYP